jgi:curli biogenesis system outer membrane secretion channel CsgG
MEVNCRNERNGKNNEKDEGETATMNFSRKKIFTVFFVLAAVLTEVGTAGAAVDQRIRIGILPFDNKAKGINVEQADIITDVFTRELVQSKQLAIFERTQLQKIGEEQRFEQSALVEQSTAIEVGKIAGVQYILLGSITQFEKKASGAAVYGVVFASDQAAVTIEMRIIDVTTSEVRLALRAEGTSKNDSVGFLSGNVSFVEGKFSGGEASAIADAVATLAHDVRTTLGGESSHVIAATGDDIAIDVTAPREGILYLVYSDGRRLTDMEGNLIGMDKVPIAVIKVIDVNTGHSIATVVPNGGDKNLIQRGDKVEPISPEKAKQLANGKKFVTSRPKGQSGTFESIFGKDSGAASPSQESLPTLYSSKSGSEQNSSIPASAPAASNRPLENISTDPRKVIPTYNLSPGEANIRRITHLNARKLDGKKAYDQYIELVNSYGGDYLAAYQAGEAARKLRKGDDARTWYNKSIQINPNYKPAQEALKKID